MSRLPASRPQGHCNQPRAMLRPQSAGGWDIYRPYREQDDRFSYLDPNKPNPAASRSWRDSSAASIPRIVSLRSSVRQRRLGGQTTFVTELISGWSISGLVTFNSG